MPLLSDKEVVVLDNLARTSSLSQRELSKTTGFSVGLINLILKKFLNTGYIKIARLNKRKVEYVLTPQGFIEAAKRSYHYATKAIRNYYAIHADLAHLLGELHASGYTYFSIHGDGELRQLIELIFTERLDESVATLGREHRAGPEAVVLNVEADPIDPAFAGKVVNVLSSIGQVP